MFVDDLDSCGGVDHTVHEGSRRVYVFDDVTKLLVDLHPISHGDKVHAADRLVLGLGTAEFVVHARVLDPVVFGIDEPSFFGKPPSELCVGQRRQQANHR